MKIVTTQWLFQLKVFKNALGRLEPEPISPLDSNLNYYYTPQAYGSRVSVNPSTGPLSFGPLPAMDNLANPLEAFLSQLSMDKDPKSS